MRAANIRITRSGLDYLEGLTTAINFDDDSRNTLDTFLVLRHLDDLDPIDYFYFSAIVEREMLKQPHYQGRNADYVTARSKRIMSDLFRDGHLESTKEWRPDRSIEDQLGSAEVHKLRERAERDQLSGDWERVKKSRSERNA